MRISIFGLGYVGAVTGACLASRGHTIIGVDVDNAKVEAFAAGEASIVEPGLPDLLKKAAAEKLLQGTTDYMQAIQQSDVSIVCVGTPSAEDGSLNLKYVETTCQQIAKAIAGKKSKHSLVMRSTMLPGSTDRMIAKFFHDFKEMGLMDVYYFPEFLREGTAVKDFTTPALVVVGTDDGRSSPKEMEPLFGTEAQFVKYNAAELVKYCCNTFHALKLTFANEIGRISKKLGLDALSVMRIICTDKKLNISPAYMLPGNPFGGSCLPKDIRALTRCALDNGVEIPLIGNLLSSNETHFQNLYDQVKSSGCDEFIILGLSFKANTDDLRESPMCKLAQRLCNDGCKLRIYDKQLNQAKGAENKERIIDKQFPELAKLLEENLEAALGKQGLVIAAQKCVDVEELRQHLKPEHKLLDVNGWTDLRALPNEYNGFCWEI